jgi:hypothetical protein
MYTTKAQICIRRDTATNFNSANPTLALGEIAYETDTRNLKVGDGSTTWQFLPYINPFRGTAAAPTSNTVLGLDAGKLLEAGAARNTIIGELAGDAITTGDDNVAVGRGALSAASTSNQNTAVGASAAAATTGGSNTAVGYLALASNVNGVGSIAIGSGAMQNFAPSTSDSNNTAIGTSVLGSLTTGLNHTAVGQNAAFAVQTGSNTTAVGTFALLRNLASDNTAVGSAALQNNTLGILNVAVGRGSLQFATTQAATVTISNAGSGGTPGTYLGVQLTYVSGPTAVNYPTADIVVGAGGTVTSVTIVNGGNAFTATSGTVMTAATGSIGNTTGFTCTLATAATASSNTAVGHNAGLAVTTAIRTTFVGSQAGDAVSTGNDNVAIGSSAATALTISGDVVAVGSSALATASTNGSGTVAVGSAALAVATTTPSATAVGSLSLLNATTATNMVAVGHQAGRYVGTGTTNCTNATNSIFIGQDARPSGDSQANQIVIGTQGRGNGSNTTTIGNTSTTGTFIPAGDLTLTNGNFIVGTSGKGIDFSATTHAGGMTSELLADYEEGTWTPTYEAATGTFTTLTMDVTGAKYIKVGKQVTVIAGIRTDNVDATGASGALRIAGLPFTASSVGRSAASLGGSVNWAGDTPLNGIILESTSRIDLYYRDASDTADLNVAVSDMTTGATANQNNLYLTATYFTD